MFGSSPAFKKHTDTIEVVVVFPCVPEIPIVFSKAFVSSPKKSDLSIKGIFKLRASTISGSSLEMAAVKTIASAFLKLSIS